LIPLRKAIFSILIVFFAFNVFSRAEEGYPKKPITFIVHSKPGSAIDITTRRLTQIASKYTSATLLVENKTGGSGVIAMQTVLNRKADGYTVLAVTKSFISTTMLTQSGVNLDDFEYLAAMVIDPEVLITNRNSDVRTLEDIIADSKRKNGKQKWLGPLVGGVDHLMAVQTWEKLKIRAEWIPYEGGADALAALMGRHGAVYVGNPVDIKGRPALMLAVVAAENRLPEYPETPTFLELGYDIPNEVLWRGYATAKGVPDEAHKYLLRLFEQVSRDPEWISFIRQSGAMPEFIANYQFAEMVKKDRKKARKYLVKAGLLGKGNAEDENSGNLFTFVVLLCLFLITLLFYKKIKPEKLNGEAVISTGLIYLAIFLYSVTLDFPAGKIGGVAGPAAMPRLWIYGLLFFSGWLLVSSLRGAKIDRPKSDNLRKAVFLAVLMGVYIPLTEILGFFFMTFFFLLSGFYLLGYKKKILAVVFALGFVVFSWLVFGMVLKVPLPAGIIG
jgi:tripartite-type tricarboxylate transporter receptor subunit TctC